MVYIFLLTIGLISSVSSLCNLSSSDAVLQHKISYELVKKGPKLIA